jgi:hypothetical protein
VADTAMAAVEGVLDTTTSVVGRGGRGRQEEDPCAASAGAAAAAAAVVAVVAAVNSPQNRVDHDSRNMGVDDDILDFPHRCYQTIRIHARPLPVNLDALPIQGCPGNTVVGAVVVVVAVGNHSGHTVEEAPSTGPVEVVRDDSLVDVAARSKVGSMRS